LAGFYIQEITMEDIIGQIVEGTLICLVVLFAVGIVKDEIKSLFR